MQAPRIARAAIGGGIMSRIAIDEQQLGDYTKILFGRASVGVNISLRICPDNEISSAATNIKDVAVNGEGLEPLIKAMHSKAYAAAKDPQKRVFAPIIAGLGDRLAVNK